MPRVVLLRPVTVADPRKYVAMGSGRAVPSAQMWDSNAKRAINSVEERSQEDIPSR